MNAIDRATILLETKFASYECHGPSVAKALADAGLLLDEDMIQITVEQFEQIEQALGPASDDILDFIFEQRS